MGRPLDRDQAKQRLAEMRGNLGRSRSASPSPPDPDPPPPDSSPEHVLDDPAAMSMSMERAAHVERLEATIRERDARLEQLEAEVERQRRVLARMAALLGEALAPDQVESES